MWRLNRHRSQRRELGPVESLNASFPAHARSCALRSLVEKGPGFPFSKYLERNHTCCSAQSHQLTRSPDDSLGTPPVSTHLHSPTDRAGGSRVEETVSLVCLRLHSWLRTSPDRQVLLWDFHQDDISKPSRAYSGPRVSTLATLVHPGSCHDLCAQSNIFALAFSATNQYLYT